MGNYRAVVRHVRFWRGEIQRWSTVYPFTGSLSSGLTSTDAQTVLTADDKMCSPPVTAHCAGSYECQLYDVATGGVPVAVYTAFDWTTPATWINHVGTYWGTQTTWDTYAESALSVRYAAGLSSSGKPVFLRKWYHSVPSSTAGTPGGVDIVSGTITTLTTGATALIGVLGAKGLTMGTPSGRFAGTAVPSPYIEAHQMPRGRRRKALVSATGHYSGVTITLPGGPVDD